eukprot:scaffold58041_cov75-Phaeocystis_antarctica.AAC.3
MAARRASAASARRCQAAADVVSTWPSPRRSIPKLEAASSARGGQRGDQRGVSAVSRRYKDEELHQPIMQKKLSARAWTSQTEPDRARLSQTEPD